MFSFWKERKKIYEVEEFMCTKCGKAFLEQEWVRETRKDEEYIEDSLPHLNAVINDMKKGRYVYCLRCPGCKQSVFASKVAKIRR